MKLLKFFNSTRQSGIDVVSPGGAAVGKKNREAHSAYQELKPDIRHPLIPINVNSKALYYAGIKTLQALRGSPDRDEKKIFTVSMMKRPRRPLSIVRMGKITVLMARSRILLRDRIDACEPLQIAQCPGFESIKRLA